MSEHVINLADELVRKLGEHCESVQLFVTYPEGNGETAGYSVGDGNFYARLGQTKEWLIRQDEYTRTHARKQQEGQ